MAQRYPRDHDRNAPQNPPNSVANPGVRKTALRAYLGPILVFFLVVGAALVYWAMRPDPPQDTSRTAATETSDEARGTSGESPTSTDTPGGHEPQRTPGSTADEIEHRTGAVVTELGDLLDEKARGEAGRRVQVTDVDVDAVDSPTSFWVRDGNARVQVIWNAGRTEVRPGQQVTIAGTAEPAGQVLRIRASSVTVTH